MTADPPRPRLELVQRGDGGFAAVYADHHDFVRRTVRALGVPDHAADDATQDVFIIVHRRLPGFDHRAPVKAWVFGIARNLARKYRERQGRPRPQLQLVHGGAPEQPDDAVQWREAASVVERFLAGLDEDKRTVFVLAELEGMTAPEVAEILGTKLNTVYSRLRAGRALFARAVARAEAARDRRSPHDG
jgi:RNA polymerase sigma-70 factor (ECF subfamily)